MNALHPVLAALLSCSLVAASPPVDDLVITVQDATTLRLTWSPVSGGSGYNMYRGTDPWFEPTPSNRIASTADTFLTCPRETSRGFFLVCVVMGNDLVIHPPGEFVMGEPYVSQPEHSVRLTHTFALSRFEVSNQEFMEALQWAYDHELVSVSIYNRVLALPLEEELLDLNDGYGEFAFADGQFALLRCPSAAGWGFGEALTYDPAPRPVQNINWYAAASYCDWRSLMEDLTPYYSNSWSEIPHPRNPYDSRSYRLPTEAEWEYAAQFNDERTWPWGLEGADCQRMNQAVNCVGWSSPVGTHGSGVSGLGLHDLCGNALEWCNDRHGEFDWGDTVAVTDPVGHPFNSERSRRAPCGQARTQTPQPRQVSSSRRALRRLG